MAHALAAWELFPAGQPPGFYYPVGTHPNALAVGDVNGDGALDIATAHNYYYNGHTSVLLLFGDGTGGFSPHTELDMGDPDWIGAIALEDVDGNGSLDIVVTNSGGEEGASESAVSVRLGNGDGTFGPRAEYGVGPCWGPLALADLDVDGALDIVCPGGTWHSLSVLLGNGEGAFGSQSSLDTGGDVDSVDIGDLNGDGIPDVVAGVGWHDVSVLVGVGDGTFAAPVTYEAPDASEVVLADVDGDGALDAVSNASVLLGAGDGTFGPPIALEPEQEADAVIVADLNRDGLPDIAWCSDEDTVCVRLGNGDGTFASEPLVHSVRWGHRYIHPFAMASGDFDSDSVPDLVTANWADHSVTVLLGNGDGTFEHPGSFGNHPSGAGAPTLGDLDGDGLLDIISAGYYGMEVALGEGDGTFAAPTVLDAGEHEGPPCLGDLNGDAALDVVVLNGWGGDGLTVLLGNGDGSFGPSAHVDTPDLSYAAKLGDLDGNGVLDIVAAGGEAIWAFLGVGDGTFGPPTTATDGWLLSHIALGDMDGDDVLDIVTYGDADDMLYVLLGIGDGTFAPRVPSVTAGRPDGIALGDVNRDGALDVVHTDNVSEDAGRVFVLIGEGDGTLAPPVSYIVGGDPYDLALGDVNGDHALDIIIENEPMVCVLMGDGDGAFGTPLNFRVGSEAGGACGASWLYGLALGDLNNDGALDAVSVTEPSESYASSTAVLLGDGEGTFGAQRLGDGLGRGPHSIIAEELGAAGGPPDIVVVDERDGTVSVLLGSGQASFGPAAGPQLHPAGGEPRDLATGDLDGNGILDIVAVNDSENEISVLLGTGGGAFAPFVAYHVDGEPHSVALADFDDDGALDIAAPSDTAFCTTVSVLFGNGDGTFAAETTHETGLERVRELAAGDLNGDGVPDLAVQPGCGEMVVLLSNGSRGFTAQPPICVEDSIHGFLLGDLDGDGVMDIFGGSSIYEEGVYTGRVFSLLGNGDGTFGQPWTVDFDIWADLFALGDVNEDGVPDIVSWCLEAPPPNFVLLGNGDGTFTVGGTFDAPDYSINDLVLEDVDGDGLADIVTSEPLDEYSIDRDKGECVAVRRSNGDGTFGLPERFGVGGDPVSIVLADVNADGQMDVVAGLHEEAVSVLLNLGNGRLVRPGTTYAGPLPVSADIGDVNGDGVPDLVTANSGDDTVSVLMGTGDESFAPATTLDVGSEPSSVVLTDLNGDASLDIVAANRGDDTVSVLLGNGDGTFGSPTTLDAGDAPSAVAIGDADGDGAPDIVVANEASQDVSILLASGDGTFLPQLSIAVDQRPSAVVLGDLSGDGILDIATANTQDSTVSVLLGVAAAAFSAPEHHAVPVHPMAIATSDMDLDGDLDLVTTSHDHDSVSILAGIGDGTFAPSVAFTVGIAPHGLDLVDMNADGALDIVTADYNGRTVTILRNQASAFWHEPDGIASAPVDALTFHLGKAMDTTSFAPADDVVSFTGPQGPITVGGFDWPDDGTLGIAFEPQSSPGKYEVVIGPHIMDLDGRPMDDEYVATFTINAPPSIASLTPDPNPVDQGQQLELTANGVSDPDGSAT